MTRGVQVVHELRPDRGLREHEPNGGSGMARVVVEHGDEGVVRRRVDVQLTGGLTGRLGQPVERLVAFAKKLADLTAGSAPVFVRKALSGIGQHELVRLFDGVAPRGECGRRWGGCRVTAHGRPAGGFAVTRQRSGS